MSEGGIVDVVRVGIVDFVEVGREAVVHVQEIIETVQEKVGR